MSKVLKTAAIVVGAVALVATGVGAAAGIGIGLGLTAGTLATVATVATVASFASAALTLAVGLTAKKPSATATGSQEQFSADPDAGIPLVIGRTGTAGNIAFRRGFDTRDAGDNDRQAFIATLSLGPVDAIEGMTVDKVPTFFGGTGAAIGAFAGFMWSMTQIGAVPEPTALTFGAGGNPPGWTAQSGLSGLAAASWMLRFDTKAKVYQSGVPAPMWTVRGVLAYDPRKDSTYPGGSGAHRMADPSDTAAYDAAVKTWEWTEDPYLMGLRWAHGFWQRDPRVAGSTYQRVMGMGAPWAGIDVAAFVEGANIAKANGWTVGGVIFSGDEKWATMKKILQAGMGEPLALGARISCLVNAPKVSLATITVDDVIGEASVSATQPRRDRFNTVTPRYRLEANNWQLLPGSPISVAEHVAEDRGKRSKVLDYPFIQNTPQVATAARYDIENAREFGPIVLPLKLVWMGYKPGDCVTADLPEIGLNNQPILLLNRDLDPSAGTTTMTARSETAAKHPFALGQTTTPPPTPGVTGPMLIPIPGDGAWTISGTSIVSGQATVPALIVTGAIDAGSAEAVVLEYRKFVSGQAANVNWSGAGVFDPTLTRQAITSVQSGTDYEVAVSYRRQGFTGDRRIVGPVTTAGAKLDFDAVDGPNKPDDRATNSGDPNSPFGPVKTVAEALVTLDRIQPLGEATELLKKANIDQDAILRQADRDRVKLAAAQIAGLLETNAQRVTLRDAGMVTDAETGRVYIYAVDQNDKRVSKVEIGLDAVSGQVALRATYNDVAAAIAQAQLSPGDAAELGGLISRMNAAEVSISGLTAAIALKADAVTVTQMGGIVQNLSLTLDALAGTVATKVSYTDFTPLRERVGAAEQTLLSYGDVSSYGVTLRQAEVRQSGSAAAQLADLLTSFETGQRLVVRAAEVQQQLYARLVDGDAAEAASRLVLAARVGDAEGRIGNEEYIRASETGVLTRSVAALSADFGDAKASISQLTQAVSDGDHSNATAITQLSARIGEFGLVSVQQAFEVLADRTGKIEGTLTMAIDTNGNLVGTKLIGSPNGPGSLNLINADLKMGTGRVIFRAGSYEKRGGANFGKDGNLLEWYGPAAVPLGQETILNSRFATANDGKLYYGGEDLGNVGVQSGRVRELGLTGSVSIGGSNTAQLAVASAIFPTGGKIRISGRLGNAVAARDEGNGADAASYFTIRFYTNYGSGPQLIAEAPCSITPGSNNLSDGVAALAGRLFDNPGPGGQLNISATVQRGGDPNSGIRSNWTGSAIVEWVNA